MTIDWRMSYTVYAHFDDLDLDATQGPSGLVEEKSTRWVIFQQLSKQVYSMLS